MEEQWPISRKVRLTCQDPASDRRTHVELPGATVHESGQRVSRNATSVTGHSNVEDTRVDCTRAEEGRGWI